MKNDPTYEQMWALSALLLSICAIHKLAWEEIFSEDIYLSLAPSLIRTNCPRVSDFYDNHRQFEAGRKLLLSMWQKDFNKMTVAYISDIMRIEKRLSRNANLLARLQKKLLELQRQAQFFPLNHQTMIEHYARTYGDIFSQNIGSVNIYGHEDYLSKPQSLTQVRALLFCAVRAVALWRANGGRRWKLIFHTKKRDEIIRSLQFIS